MRSKRAASGEKSTVSTIFSRNCLLQALPWLPRPAGKLREQISRCCRPTRCEALRILQSLAQAAWGEAELRSLGRKIRGILKSAPANFGAEAAGRKAWCRSGS